MARIETLEALRALYGAPHGRSLAKQLDPAREVVVFERADRIGGLLRYGIPEFKMEKSRLDRRLQQMKDEGTLFRASVDVGTDITASQLRAEFDAVVLAGGATAWRDIPVDGRELTGIHQAMEFLPWANHVQQGDIDAPPVSAEGKHVVIIGGGGTGADCLGTSHRQGAASVTQLEIMPMPPERENKALTWPEWPLKLRTSSSHQEGVERDFAVVTRRFLGKDGKVTGLECARVEWVVGDDGRMQMQEVEGSVFELKADLVFLAMGFVGPVKAGVVEQSGVDLDPRGNVRADTLSYQTSDPKIFACGDARRGQSLVVWAIREGRQCARAVDEHLMGSTRLPR